MGMMSLLVPLAMLFGTSGPRAVPPWSRNHTLLDDPWAPVALSNWINDVGLEGNFYNSYNTGGYLAYRHFPKCKVFIYGTIIMFERHNPAILDDHNLIMANDNVTGRLLDEWSVDVLIAEPAMFTSSFCRSCNPLSEAAAHESDTKAALDVGAVLRRAPEGWVLAMINREGAVWLRRDGDDRRRRNIRKCREFYGARGITWSGEKGFDPLAVVHNHASFALRYNLVKPEFYDSLAALAERTADSASTLYVARGLERLSLVPAAHQYYERTLAIDDKRAHALLGAARCAHALGNEREFIEYAKRAQGLIPRRGAIVKSR